MCGLITLAALPPRGPRSLQPWTTGPGWHRLLPSAGKGQPGTQPRPARGLTAGSPCPASGASQLCGNGYTDSSREGWPVSRPPPEAEVSGEQAGVGPAKAKAALQGRQADARGLGAWGTCLRHCDVKKSGPSTPPLAQHCWLSGGQNPLVDCPGSRAVRLNLELT